jgi:hypothetical protein
MKTFINEIEHERNTASHVILFAEDTSSILAVYPTKALPRPFKNNPSKMTKGSDTPWKLPGDKRKLGETLHEAAARGLRQKTGLTLGDLGATLLASDTVFIAKDAVVPASWVAPLCRVCPVSKELVPKVLHKNIGLRDAIATWRSARDAFDVHEFLHATLTSRPSWAA